MMHPEPEYIRGRLEPYYVITPVYKFVYVNTLSLKLLDYYDIAPCYAEVNSDNSINYHTAFVDDNRYDFSEYENALVTLSMNTGVIDNDKYLFKTIQEAEKILAKLLYYTFDNNEYYKLKKLLEIYPEAII